VYVYACVCVCVYVVRVVRVCVVVRMYACYGLCIVRPEETSVRQKPSVRPRVNRVFSKNY
jgi:hypothetical protein